MFGKVGPPVNQQPADLSVSRIGEDSGYEEKRQLVTVAHTFHINAHPVYLSFMSPYCSG